MPHVDLIVLVLLAAGLLASVIVPWRRGVRGRRLLATAMAAFYGHTLVTMLAFHCIDILYGLANRLQSMTGAPFRWDWRTYSLLLFGTLLVRLGADCLTAAAGIARGEPAARARFLRRAALVLGLVLPIVPIHAFFGYLISGATALALLVVAAAGRERARVAPPSVAPAVLAPAAPR
jgi:hypothetical protein